MKQNRVQCIVHLIAEEISAHTNVCTLLLCTDCPIQSRGGEVSDREEVLFVAVQYSKKECSAISISLQEMFVNVCTLFLCTSPIQSIALAVEER